jgi:hypothetical protein
MKNLKNICLIIIILLGFKKSFSQSVPGREENIDYVATFGKEAKGNWGDDDHVQTYFFAVPKTQNEPCFIRVFDADCAGDLDQINKEFNTQTKYSIYGGKNCYSEKDARLVDPIGKYKSGNLLKTKTFSNEKEYNNTWYTFGPFNPKEGEYDKELNAYVFKIITEGISGDDGNMYRYFFSTQSDKNIAVEGGNSFTYEVCFRLINQFNESAHLFPFCDSAVVSVMQHNYDYDKEGDIVLTTLIKKLHPMTISGDNEWASSKSVLTANELNTSLNLQFVKQTSKTNDLTFYITNQYGTAIPMFSSPIGGIPKYRYKIDVQYQFDKK